MSSSNPLGDDRFGAMFESSAFEVDPESEEYARAHPTSLIANKMVGTPQAGWSNTSTWGLVGTRGGLTSFVLVEVCTLWTRMHRVWLAPRRTATVVVVVSTTIRPVPTGKSVVR